MPLQNRVLPTGEITAVPARGTLTGNRGILHRANQMLGTARWTHQAWICCTLDWKGWRRDVMTGRNWTELFFLDEAVALAAGHRPCGYCRRAAYAAYRTAWAQATGQIPGAKDMDAALHPARVTRQRQQVTYQAVLGDLPSGAFVRFGSQLYLVWNDTAFPYSPEGYAAPIVLVRETMVSVLTPRPTIAVLAAGYLPLLHPTANLSKT